MAAEVCLLPGPTLTEEQSFEVERVPRGRLCGASSHMAPRKECAVRPLALEGREKGAGARQGGASRRAESRRPS